MVDVPKFPRLGLYILDEDGNPQPTDDIDVWAMWRASQPSMHVAEDWILGEYRVSTVFLGVDHNWAKIGPPLLWETMIFRGRGGIGYQERYGSRAEALAGHARACYMVKDTTCSESSDNAACPPAWSKRADDRGDG